MRRACLAIGLAAAMCLGMAGEPVWGQSIGSGSIRPFVTGFVPVIGPNGAVGGVSVDPRGMVSLAGPAEASRLRKSTEKALKAAPLDLRKTSPLRKVSLKQLDLALARWTRKQGRPGADDNNHMDEATREIECAAQS